VQAEYVLDDRIGRVGPQGAPDVVDPEEIPVVPTVCLPADHHVGGLRRAGHGLHRPLGGREVHRGVDHDERVRDKVVECHGLPHPSPARDACQMGRGTIAR
jgi:hypothetical protein